MVLRSQSEFLGEGEAMIPMERETLLREASKLKLQGMRLRNFGDANEQREATLLLRKAAKNELAALELQANPSEEEQARARIESCGLFLDAHDPIRAAEQWNQIPRKFCPPNDEASWLDRLSPRYHEVVDHFGRHWRAIKPRPDSIPDAAGLSQEQIHSLATRYSGVPEFWWALSRYHKDQDALDWVKVLEPDYVRDEVATRAWQRIEEPFVQRLRIKVSPARRGGILRLDVVGRVATAFSDLLSDFVDGFLDRPVELIPIGATPGSFVWNVDAWGLPSYAIAELQERATVDPAEVGVNELVKLLEQLDQHKIDLTASIATQDTRPPQLVFGAERRKTLLDAARTVSEAINSNEIPQANRLERVFRLVEMHASGEEINADTFGEGPRDVVYYRRAAKILGFLDESDRLTLAGRQIARLTNEHRMRATVVYFESSVCGDGWIRWAKKQTLLEVEPESAQQFIEQCVSGLSATTVDRRAQTLMAWHADLIPYHYSKR